MAEGYQALTEKEKQTLRLIVRGHDAKSIARHLELSVHTVNERLRYARRKMSVSSSREAARLLLEKEGGGPDFLADKQLGEAEPTIRMREDAAPNEGRRTRNHFVWAIGGILTMSLVLTALALNSITAPVTGVHETAPDNAVASATIVESEAVRSAQEWLILVDEGRWIESWSATGRSFKKLNTSKAWASVSEEVRPPLGAVLSRTASSQESVPAPPYGYEVVKFRTSFANKPDATETVTLAREDQGWKVVGYWIS
ncbi:hypothetical protein GCM10011494_04590 [Novosphingobium endophyticum]|uniref:HTH luxR-type domain-containing protein n=1 Tax=Novosphingobium endophyticum TaxID=1955250 RepID=A0A916X4J7_9SPHN|nr:DUF4019 domain-containing protein [Novosphingobium endophyticum]GGB89335.1 hypothetical protein GCM10011494_04590 [Novosphingobium endophyticum]